MKYRVIFTSGIYGAWVRDFDTHAQAVTWCHTCGLAWLIPSIHGLDAHATDAVQLERELNTQRRIDAERAYWYAEFKQENGE